MVKFTTGKVSRFLSFQYSLCRVVLMVLVGISPTPSSPLLSVLALSSRFDGQNAERQCWPDPTLSVLALSSRFDGLGAIQQGAAWLLLSVLALSSRFDGPYG